MSAADRPVAVVLGAGIGGRAVAKRLAGTHHIVVVDRDADLAGAARDLVVDAGGSAESTVVDLTDLAAVESFRDDVLTRHGRVDLVVHLVGGWRGSSTVDAEALANWTALEPGIITTVQTASVAFRDALAAAPAGRFVMVSSTSAAKPTAGNVAYAAAKAAAEAWVVGLDHAFRDSAARARVLVVMALVDDRMRSENPERNFDRYTDVADLADAVATVVAEDGGDTRVILAP